MPKSIANDSEAINSARRKNCGSDCLSATFATVFYLFLNEFRFEEVGFPEGIGINVYLYKYIVSKSKTKINVVLAMKPASHDETM